MMMLSAGVRGTALAILVAALMGLVMGALPAWLGYRVGMKVGEARAEEQQARGETAVMRRLDLCLTLAEHCQKRLQACDERFCVSGASDVVEMPPANLVAP